VPEYGRQRWEELRETLSLDELVAVARTQIEWEDRHTAQAAAQGRGWVVCDTTPLTTLQYALHDHAGAHALPQMTALHTMARRAYELTVLCEPDFDFVQDGCRRDDGFRHAQHAWTLQQLAAHGVQPLRVRGSVAARVAAVRQALAASERLSAAGSAPG
jgi:nicotinamide riboside kinase